MIKPAIIFEDELKNKFRNIWFNDFYKYYDFGTYYEDIELAKDTWKTHQFVSIDKTDNIIGYISYDINRQTNNVYNFGVISFEPFNLTFGKDLHKVIDDIFNKFNFHKLSFFVCTKNPIKSYYDRMIKKHNGRFVGIQYNEVKLVDNKLYDVALYELSKQSYNSVITKIHKN